MKDDFENAKDEIKGLKVKVEQLNRELLLAKKEAMVKKTVEEEVSTLDMYNLYNVCKIHLLTLVSTLA